MSNPGLDLEGSEDLGDNGEAFPPTPHIEFDRHGQGLAERIGHGFEGELLEVLSQSGEFENT